MNESVRRVPAERLYPLTEMTANTANNVVDVATFCRDNNMAATMILVVSQQMAVTPTTVDFTPCGQDENHHYVVPLIPYCPLPIAVKTVYLATSGAVASEIFILGINP